MHQQSLPERDCQAPALRRDGEVVSLAGDWSLQALALPGEVQTRRRALGQAGAQATWDLRSIERLDTIGANLLWHAWGEQLPERLRLTDGQREVFQTLQANAGEAPPAPPARDLLGPVRAIGQAVFDASHHGLAMIRMLGQLMLDLVGLLLRPARGPWREISAQIYRSGAQALGITALVGFLIGVVLSYLSAQQLQIFGADRFIVRLLGVSIVRELGPVLAAILVAGRSGSAITAQIGVMRVTQELDAMEVMGISHSQRLILPRVLALAVTMPLLVLWTDAMALMGGMLAAQMQLGVSAQWFIESLPSAITLTNYWIGLLKGMTFGVLIALVACHFGLRIKPDTESLGRGTTTSVVTAITGVILVDALYAVIFSQMGI
ncbi:ABC transporter permease [Bordetella trematum]|uniref:Membrane protein n=1 Tax=Bordetella trematum TaxID=123899 RepID=A0A157RGF4_9BORD|nr:ABC transporter permease [Bordetella trematum]AUL45656.1 ABC transporter permease [Bordetella trematum]AZR92451.1 ABC transporter permease [Bordetella trematum]NNH20214.1 ABC transporter permease [Bordetella trematum]QIM71026.1 ABC transporter permease [Bordetella trematum]SAI57010.1 membrane protein [Bordetella trematum]